MNGKVSLTVTKGPNKGAVFEFTEHDTFIFGRMEDCHACIPDDNELSRHHFILEVSPPHASLRDLGSLNGTYVNGKKCGGREDGESPEEGAKRQYPIIEIRDGTNIDVGKSSIAVAVQQPKQKAVIEPGLEAGAMAGGRVEINVWSSNGRLIRKLQPTGRWFDKLQFSGNSRFLLGAGAGGSSIPSAIIIWDVTSGRQLRTIPLKASCFDACTWNEATGMICVGHEEGSISICQLNIPQNQLFLSVARPTSVSEISNRNSAYIDHLEAAWNAFHAREYRKALQIVRNLQENWDMMTDPQLGELERKVTSNGKRIRLERAILGGKIELATNVNGRSFRGYHYFNRERTQMLWMEHHDNEI